MHYFIRFAAFFALFVLPLLAGAVDKQVVNENVKFSIALKEKSLKAGQKGTLLFSLTPKEGIHVNLTPPMSAKIDTGGQFSVAGVTQPPSSPANSNFYDAGKPIVQEIQVAASAKPGKNILKGVFSYFFCSDAEGWCSKFKQPFEVAVTIAK